MVGQEEVFQTRAVLLEKVRDIFLARSVGPARICRDVIFLVHFYAGLRPLGIFLKTLYSTRRHKAQHLPCTVSCLEMMLEE